MENDAVLTLRRAVFRAVENGTERKAACTVSAVYDKTSSGARVGSYTQLRAVVACL